jgi:subfamily B ATP-binding cassette protein MsbA
MGIVAGMNGSIPFLIRSVLDWVFVHHERRWLLPLSITIVLLFTIKGVALYLEGLITGFLGQKVIYDLRSRAIEQILSLDLSFFHSQRSGELVSRIVYDAGLIFQAVSRAISALFHHGLTIIGLMGVAFYLHYKFAIIALCVLPVAFFPIYRFGELIRHHWRKGQEEIAHLSSSLFEIIQGIRVIKGFQLEETFKKNLLLRLDSLLNTWKKIVRIQAGSQPLMEWIGAVGMAFVIYLGGRWVIEGSMSTGTFFAFLSSIFLLYDPVRKLNGTWQEIQQGISAAERLTELFSQKPSILERRSSKRNTFEKELRLENLSFRYHPRDPWVLRNLFLVIPKGTKIAIVGHSGEGKSTLADLIMRFYDPSEGSILIDGKDIREWDLSSLRRMISRVEQHPVLFSGTVLENIWLGNLSSPLEKVLKAGEIAQVDSIVSTLPKGYDTPVGELGNRLSGGERQRIAIARAIVRDPEILILDEATSALDSEREQNLLRQLIEMLPETTIIFITHRFKVARVAEKIAVLRGGKIVEMGNHEELLLRNGFYAHLYHLSEELPVPSTIE